MTPRLLVASLALDAGIVWLVGALLDPEADPVSGPAKILWLIGLVVLIGVAGLVGYLIVSDAATPIRVVAGLVAAALAATVASAPADGFDLSARTLLIEGVVVIVLAGVALGLALMERRRSLV